MSTALQIMAIAVGVLATLSSTLVLFYLKQLNAQMVIVNSRLTKVEDDNKVIATKFAECKTDCNRTTVSKEDWVRSEGYTRKELKEVTSILSRMEGKLELVEKLPEIAGNIAAQIAKQIRDENHDKKN